MPFSKPVKVIASINGSTPYIASGLIIHSPTSPDKRPDGSSIQEGDFWYDTTYDELHMFVDDEWKLINGSGSGTVVLIGDIEPNAREDGRPLETGDFWYNTMDTELYIYIVDNFQPVSVGGGGGTSGGLTFSNKEPIRQTRRGDNIFTYFDMDPLPVMNRIYP